ncbi:MAG: cyclic nucleotide-binding domain-containing protein [Anaerolineales bacterium]|nr:cyclic nucleotide-binding domain-containing protein [Anaerolineales bacterium]
MAPNNLTPSRLATFELFVDMPAEEITALESALEEKRLPKGKDVFREGEKARYVYFLLEGRVSIWYRRGDEEEQVRVLEPGELFGEEAILGTGLRHASAFVEADSRVLRISHPALHERLRGLPLTAEMLRTAARGRQLVRGRSFHWLTPDETVYLATRKTNLLLVPNLAPPVLFGLLSLGGVVVIRQQSWPDAAYLIAGAGLLAALAYGAWSAVDWGNDFYLVTNRRVVALRRVPLIYDDRQETPLDMIQSVSSASTVSQRAFGYGDVTVRTYTRPIVLRSIPNPKAAARLIETIWKRRQVREEQDDRAEIGRLLESRLNQKHSAEASLEGTEAPETGAGQTAPSAPPAPALGGMQTRVEQGGVVTYRKHKFFLMRNLFLPVLLILAAIPIGALLTSGVLPVDPLLGITVVIGVLAAGLGWSAYEYLDWANDLYQVTPEQILALHRKPLGDEERRAAGLENILSLEYDRPSLLARLLNFGTLKAVVGQVNFTFDEIGDPVHVQEDIFRRMEVKKRRASDSQRRQRREEIADWIETYHNLTRPGAGGAEPKEQK